MFHYTLVFRMFADVGMVVREVWSIAVDKGKVLPVVGYHYLVYSQAAPELIQHLCLIKLSYNYVMQLVHNVLVAR